MNQHNPPYSDLYKGYFDLRDPYTDDLERVYQDPLPIPIYTADELFCNQTLASIDLHIFKYFHFIAARSFVVESLKKLYLDYRDVKQNLLRQMELYAALSSTDKQDTEMALTLDEEVDFLFQDEHYQSELGGRRTLDLADFYSVVQHTHFKHKKALLDFQSNLEEERKIAILNAY
ncbi:MAG TPA: hypothetical protein VKB19_09940 [Pedobacter sp.]|nr:hypothetical protein [Pedobacter sp.]